MSPKCTPNKILVQCAVYKPEEDGLSLGEISRKEWSRRFPPAEHLYRDAAVLEGLFLQLANDASMQLARKLFGAFLGGQELVMQGGIIRYSFHDSPHRIYLGISSDAKTQILLRDSDRLHSKDVPISLRETFHPWNGLRSKL